MIARLRSTGTAGTVVITGAQSKQKPTELVISCGRTCGTPSVHSGMLYVTCMMVSFGGITLALWHAVPAVPVFYDVGSNRTDASAPPTPATSPAYCTSDAPPPPSPPAQPTRHLRHPPRSQCRSRVAANAPAAPRRWRAVTGLRCRRRPPAALVRLRAGTPPEQRAASAAVITRQQTQPGAQARSGAGRGTALNARRSDYSSDWPFAFHVSLAWCTYVQAVNRRSGSGGGLLDETKNVKTSSGDVESPLETAQKISSVACQKNVEEDEFLRTEF